MRHRDTPLPALQPGSAAMYVSTDNKMSARHRLLRRDKIIFVSLSWRSLTHKRLVRQLRFLVFGPSEPFRPSFGYTCLNKF